MFHRCSVDHNPARSDHIVRMTAAPDSVHTALVLVARTVIEQGVLVRKELLQAEVVHAEAGPHCTSEGDHGHMAMLQELDHTRRVVVAAVVRTVVEREVGRRLHDSLVVDHTHVDLAVVGYIPEVAERGLVRIASDSVGHTPAVLEEEDKLAAVEVVHCRAEVEHSVVHRDHAHMRSPGPAS